MAINILVTGSNGQLGMCIRHEANSFAQYHFIYASKAELAIDNETVLLYFFEKYKPKFCINCAAYTAVDKAEVERELAYVANVTGPQLLAQACAQYGCMLIHLSTDYVYDGSKQQPYVPSDVTTPINYYGNTKALGEQAVLSTYANSIVIRTSWVYSAYGKNFVKTMVNLMAHNESIHVVNDQIGSPTYAPNLAQAILRVINQCVHNNDMPKGIYHYADEGIISWYTLALEVKNCIGSSCNIMPIPTSSYPTPATRSTYSVLDTSLMVQHYGVVVQPWQLGVAACVSVLAK